MIPIVMLVVPDPVAQGFVTSLAHPGGNITGLTNLVPGLSQKYVELLKEVLPSASRFAVITSPPNPVAANRRELEAAVKALGMSVSFLPVQGPEDFEPALIRAKKQGATGIIATSDPVTSLHSRILVRLALQHRLAGIYWTREYVEHGGLMTYSASLAALRQHAAIYVDKILKGAKPQRPPRRAAHEIRAGHQPEDREGPRLDHPAVAAAAGGSGDRVRAHRTGPGAPRSRPLAHARPRPVRRDGLRDRHGAFHRARLRVADDAVGRRASGRVPGAAPGSVGVTSRKFFKAAVGRAPVGARSGAHPSRPVRRMPAVPRRFHPRWW